MLKLKPLPLPLPKHYDLFNPIKWSNPIQSNTIQYNPIQPNPITKQTDSHQTFQSYTQIDLLLLLWDFSLVFVQFVADNKEHRRKKERTKIKSKRDTKKTKE